MRAGLHLAHVLVSKRLGGGHREVRENSRKGTTLLALTRGPLLNAALVGVEVQKTQLGVGVVRPWRRGGEPKRLGLEWGGPRRELPGGGSQVGVLETGPDVSEVCDIDSPLSAL